MKGNGKRGEGRNSEEEVWVMGEEANTCSPDGEGKKGIGKGE